MILLLAISLVTSVKAQNRHISDSLVKRLENAPGDSLSFEIHRKLGFYHPNPMKALQHSKMALGLASSSGNMLNVARALERVGEAQRLLGNKTESYQATYEALAIYDSLNLKKREAHLLLQIAVKLTYDQAYDEAKVYFNKSLQAFVKTQDVPNQVASLINLGEALRLSNELDEAIDKFREALQLNGQINHPRYRAYALGNLGMAHRAQNKLLLASAELKEAVWLLKELDDPFSIVTFEGEIGQIELVTGHKEKGLQRIQKAFQLAKKHQVKEQIKELGMLLSVSYEEDGKFDQALRYYKIAKAYHDSLQNVVSVRKIEQLKAKHEFEKKDKEIAYQQVEIRKAGYMRNITWIIIIFLIVILIIAVIAYTSKQKDNRHLAKQKKEITEKEKQKKWLLSELQHRTKNNLQMISSLLNLHSRQLVGHPSYEVIKEGKLRVDVLTTIHQRLYQDDVGLKINLHNYLIELVDNLVFSFNKKVEVSYEIDQFEVDVDKVVPIALIINELVTNSLKHAFSAVSDPKLLVKFKLFSQRHVTMEIVDNGVGVKTTALDKECSFGFMLVKSFVDQLKGTIDQLSTGVGCSWQIKFDFK